MLKFGISEDSHDDKSSLCMHIISIFDWFDVSTVLLTWYVLSRDKIDMLGHGEKKLNAINKHHINTERNIFIFYLVFVLGCL